MSEPNLPDAIFDSPPVLGGQEVNGYRILDRLGAGGMGMVYEAIDTRLGRHVALKFLPPELDPDEDARGALMNEARAASALDHPNIGSIYGIEETPAGQRFIVMAYYEGQTLSRKLRHGPLPAGEAAAIALQIANGLAEAHGHRIVHRDVKPSNILLTLQGLVKIVDFGIARVIQSATAPPSTRVAGTVAYMSPEQAQGKPVDARTDLWSLGVVLYEMVSGRHPFASDDLPGTLSAIVHAPPAELTDDVPAALRKVIYRALAKRADDRYQSAAEMIQDLKTIAGPAGQASEPTITIDELDRYSKLAADQPRKRHSRLWWLSVLPLLAVILALTTISGGSSRPKAAAHQSYLKAVDCLRNYYRPGNLGKAIALLEESVKADSTSALAFASLGQAYCLESQRSNDPSVLPRAESSATRALELNGALAKVHIVMGEVQLVRGNFDLAQDQLQRALKLEPSSAEALIGIARVYAGQDRKQEAEENFRRAADLRPDSWEGYHYWGRFLLSQNRHLEAAQQFRRVIERTPENSLGYLNLGIALMREGRLDEAEALLKKAQQLDPTSYRPPGNLVLIYYKKHLFAQAVEAIKQVLALNARDWRNWKNLAVAYRWLNQDDHAVAAYREAIPLLEKDVETSPRDAFRQARLAEVYAYTGERDRAEARIRAALALDPRNASILATCADAYAALGDSGRAVELANQAVANGLTRSSLDEDPEARRFRDDPRFKLPNR